MKKIIKPNKADVLEKGFYETFIPRRKMSRCELLMDLGQYGQSKWYN